MWLKVSTRTRRHVDPISRDILTHVCCSTWATKASSDRTAIANQGVNTRTERLKLTEQSIAGKDFISWLIDVLKLLGARTDPPTDEFMKENYPFGRCVGIMSRSHPPV
jgi:hypothetical protein